MMESLEWRTTKKTTNAYSTLQYRVSALEAMKSWNIYAWEARDLSAMVIL
jgi:hypothetical protein